MTCLFLTILALLLAAWALFAYAGNKAIRPPPNCPKKFNKASHEGRVVLACIGDSLTHGSVSHSYVDDLALRLRADGERVDIVNGGINFDLAYNLYLRLDEIIASKPDIVTILIGANDVGATLNEKNLKFFRWLRKLPALPTQEWFEENLLKIVHAIKQQTSARIALFSLTVMGEEIAHPANDKMLAYSQSIKRIAGQEGVTYLPLHEAFRSFLESAEREDGYVPGKKLDDPEGPSMLKIIFAHHLFGKSYDDISKEYGLRLQTDLAHLNSTGAGIITNMAYGYVKSCLNQRAAAPSALL